MKKLRLVIPVLLLLAACSQEKNSIDFRIYAFESELTCIGKESRSDTLLVGTEEGIVYRYFPDFIQKLYLTNASDRIYKIEDLGRSADGSQELLVSVRNRGLRYIRLQEDRVVYRVDFRCYPKINDFLPVKKQAYSAYDWVADPVTQRRYIATSNGLWWLDDARLAAYRNSNHPEGIRIDSISLASSPALLEQTRNKFQYSIGSLTLAADTLYYGSQDGLWKIGLSGATAASGPGAPRRLNRNRSAILFTAFYDNTLFALGKNEEIACSPATGRTETRSTDDNRKLLFFHKRLPGSRLMLCGDRYWQVAHTRYRSGFPVTTTTANSYLQTEKGIYLISGRQLLYLDFLQIDQHIKKQPAVSACCAADSTSAYLIDHDARLFSYTCTGKRLSFLGHVPQLKGKKVTCIAWWRNRLFLASGREIYRLKPRDFFLSTAQRAVRLPVELDTGDHEITALCPDEKNGALFIGTRKKLYRYTPGAPLQTVDMRLDAQTTLSDLYESAYVTSIASYRSRVYAGTLNWELWTANTDEPALTPALLTGPADNQEPCNQIRSVDAKNDLVAVAASDSLYFFRREGEKLIAWGRPRPLYANQVAIAGSDIVAASNRGIDCFRYDPDRPAVSDMAERQFPGIYFRSVVALNRRQVLACSRRGLFLLEKNTGGKKTENCFTGNRQQRFTGSQLELRENKKSATGAATVLLAALFIFPAVSLATRIRKRNTKQQKFRADQKDYPELPCGLYIKRIKSVKLYSCRFREKLAKINEDWENRKECCIRTHTLCADSQLGRFLKTDMEKLAFYMKKDMPADYKRQFERLKKQIGRLHVFCGEKEDFSKELETVEAAAFLPVGSYKNRLDRLDIASVDFNNKLSELKKKWSLLTERYREIQQLYASTEIPAACPFGRYLAVGKKKLETALLHDRIDESFTEWKIAVTTSRNLKMLSFDPLVQTRLKEKLQNVSDIVSFYAIKTEIENACLDNYPVTENDFILMHAIARTGVIDCIADTDLSITDCIGLLAKSRENQREKISYLKQKEKIKKIVGRRKVQFAWIDRYAGELNKIRNEAGGKKQQEFFEGQTGLSEQAAGLLQTFSDMLDHTPGLRQPLFKEQETAECIRRYINGFKKTKDEFFREVIGSVEPFEPGEHKLFERIANVRSFTADFASSLQDPARSGNQLKKRLSVQIKAWSSREPHLTMQFEETGLDRFVNEVRQALEELNVTWSHGAEDHLEKQLGELETELSRIAARKGKYLKYIRNSKDNRLNFFRAFCNSDPLLDEKNFHERYRSEMFALALMSRRVSPKQTGIWLGEKRETWIDREFIKRWDDGNALPRYFLKRRDHPVIRACFDLFPPLDHKYGPKWRKLTGSEIQSRSAPR